MNKRKTVFIALSSVALIFALLIGSYVIRQNQYQEMLAVSAIENDKDIIEMDTLLSAEYDTMSDNPIKEISNVEQDDGLGQYEEPASKLSQEYEDAMANSDLQAFEKELIRSMVEKENKTFEQALQAVRPGSKVIQEQTDTQTTINNQKPQQPTTPTKPSGNTSNSATVNNPDNRSDQQKKADEDAGNAFGGGVGGKSQDVSHEPDFGLPDNRTDQQKKADEDAFEDWSGGLVGGPGGDVSHEPDF